MVLPSRQPKYKETEKDLFIAGNYITYYDLQYNLFFLMTAKKSDFKRVGTKSRTCDSTNSIEARTGL